ncbi:MAG: hypothetical protein ACPL7D_05370 [Candidatus Sumerlaeaceae bacterium]
MREIITKAPQEENLEEGERKQLMDDEVREAFALLAEALDNAEKRMRESAALALTEGDYEEGSRLAARAKDIGDFRKKKWRALPTSGKSFWRARLKRRGGIACPPISAHLLRNSSSPS